MSALAALKSLTINLPFVADAEISKRRAAVCRLCPRHSRGFCQECGCVVMVKARLAAEKCPLGKW